MAAAEKSSILINFTKCPCQKQPPRGVLKKKCSDNMQQIYKRSTMPKCNFNEIATQI